MSVTAEPGPWQLDPAQSTVTIKHKTIWGLVTVRGTFASVSGEGEVLADGTARGSLTFDAASLDTKHAKRDKHLRSADFFDVENHPRITFTAGSVTPEADGTVRVAGELTVRGKSRPLALTARASVGPDAITLSTETALDRADFDLTWNQLGMIVGLTTISADLRFVRAAG